jgi:hypothetical protein
MASLRDVNHILRYGDLVMWSLLKPGDDVSFKFKNREYTGKFFRMNKIIVWSNFVSQYEIALIVILDGRRWKVDTGLRLLSEIIFPGGGHATQPGVEYPQWSNKPVMKSFEVAFTCADFPIILNRAIPHHSTYDMVSWRSNWLCGIPGPPSELWSSYELKSDVQRMELWLKERREPVPPPTPPPGLEPDTKNRSSNKIPPTSELNKSDIKF